MKIEVTIDGSMLNSKLAAKQLHLIADLVKAGVMKSDGYNVEYDGVFDFEVGEGEDEHTDYWDGEHNHIHVDEEGIVIFRRGPDKADGEEDLEDLYEKAITVSEWAANHGGITPFTEEENEGHDHEH